MLNGFHNRLQFTFEKECNRTLNFLGMKQYDQKKHVFFIRTER